MVQATDIILGYKSKTVTDLWYCADQNGRIGPLTLQELLETLATLPNAADVLVWCDKFSDWKRAGDVDELRAQFVVPPPLPPRVPPPLPAGRAAPATNYHNEAAPTWKVKWWWVIVALLFFGSVGSQVGRREMGRASVERRAMMRRIE